MGYPSWFLEDPDDATNNTLPMSPRIESEDYAKENFRILHQTQFGVRYGYHLSKRRVHSYTFRIPYSYLDEFEEIHTATFGEVIPFYYVPDMALFVASPISGAIYCRKEKDFMPRKVTRAYWNGTLELIYDYTLTITEEIPAVEIDD